MFAMPVVEGVKVTEQLPVTNVQLVALNSPETPLPEKLTVPVGVLADPGDPSETVAVHVDCLLSARLLGEHTTDVLVARFATVTIASAEWVMSPLVPVAVKAYDPGVEDAKIQFEDPFAF
jgi:hypothetical protein